MSRLVEITPEMAARIAAAVVQPRLGVPEVVERYVVERNRASIARRLVGARIPRSAEPLLVEEVRRAHFSAMMQPGESVGIACAQAIGECVTQSALNTFHKAGLDTGVNTVMKSIEDIIDIPRSKTSRRPHIVTAYHVEHRRSLEALYRATRHHTTEVTLGSAVVAHEVVPLDSLPDHATRWAAATSVPALAGATRALRLSLSLERLFTFRVSANLLRTALGRAAVVPPFCSADETGEFLVWVPLPAATTGLEKLAEVSRHRLVGVPHAHGHSFQRDRDGDWHVVLEGAPLLEVLRLADVYDPRLTLTSRVSDIADTLGVYASRVALCRMGAEILGDSVCAADMALLATRITFTGRPMPCSRFTMRANPSPLAKISFEESQGGCRNAGVFREREAFKTLSSMVIAGKLPAIGSAVSRPVLDLDFFQRPASEGADADED